MLSNIFKDKVTVKLKTRTLGATGETVTYSPVETRWGRVIPVDVKTQLAYQQLGSVITHKIVFRQDVTLTLGDYLFEWNTKTLEPVNPPQAFAGGYFIICKEV